MKKIITVAMFIALSTVSAKAIDLGFLSITAGLATNQSVFGANATSDQKNGDGTQQSLNKEHGVFTDGFGSQFVEIGLGQWVSVGYEHTPDSISTPQNINDGGSGQSNNAKTSQVSVDFNDLNTTYVKLNTPIGVYFKYGTTETDLDIKETQLSGSTYSNVSTSGTSTGLGYQKYIGDSGFGFRFEGNYLEFDNVTANNGKTTVVHLDTGLQQNGGLNTVTGKNLEGLTGKFAITYTLGRNR